MDQLYLDPAAVDEREAKLKREGQFPKSHPIVHFVYRTLCVVLDLVCGRDAIRVSFE